MQRSKTKPATCKTLHEFVQLFARQSPRDRDIEAFCRLGPYGAGELLFDELAALPELRQQVAARFIQQLLEAAAGAGLLHFL